MIVGISCEMKGLKFFDRVLFQGGHKLQNKEKINDKLAEIFAKIGSKENTREVRGGVYDRNC